MRVLLYIVFALLLVGCNSSRHVTEGVALADTHFATIVNRVCDSVYIRDSVDRWRSGDTVYIYKAHTEYRDRLFADTVLVRDSIECPVYIDRQTTKVRVNWYVCGYSLLLGVGMGFTLRKLLTVGVN